MSPTPIHFDLSILSFCSIGASAAIYTYLLYGLIWDRQESALTCAGCTLKPWRRPPVFIEGLSPEDAKVGSEVVCYLGHAPPLNSGTSLSLRLNL